MNLCAPPRLPPGGEDRTLQLVNMGRAAAGLQALTGLGGREVYTSGNPSYPDAALAIGREKDGPSTLLGIGVAENQRRIGVGRELLYRALSDYRKYSTDCSGITIEVPNSKLPDWIRNFLARGGVSIPKNANDQLL